MAFITKKTVWLITSALLATSSAWACTGVYVGKQLTKDGSTIFGRTEDLETDHNKTFIVFPAHDNAAGAVLKDESTGFTFNLPSRSYRYTALPDVTPKDGLYHEAGTNEFGVMMDATVSVYANDAVLKIDPLVKTGITESIMTTVALPHVKTAREGVELLARVIDEKGAGEANSLIIADQDETWYMEIVSGHQYAAVLLPENKFIVFPNGMLLGEVDVSDKQNVIASPKLVEVVQKAGTLKLSGDKIRVADSYAAPMKDSVKSRYWAGVKRLNPQATVNQQSTETPFFHTTSKKISLQDVMALQRDRFENTQYIPDDWANKKDPKAANALYPIGNKNTMEAHIFQVKKGMPKDVPAVMWLSVGSPLVSPYLPFYSNIEQTAAPYQVADKTFNAQSYYWVTSRLLERLLANESSLKEPLRKAVNRIEQPFIAQANAEAKQLSVLHRKNPEQATKWITQRAENRSLYSFKQLQRITAELK